MTERRALLLPVRLAFTLYALVARVLEDHRAYLLYRGDLAVVLAGSA